MILSGRDLRWYIETGRLKIDPVREDQFQQNGVDLILDSTSNHDTLDVYPASVPYFTLGATRETLTLPDDLMAFVQLRSTWARQGVLVAPTIVDAGFHGNLTLEMVFHHPIVIPIGERFIHLVFAKLTSPTDPYRGKYHGQTGITRARPDPDDELGSGRRVREEV